MTREQLNALLAYINAKVRASTLKDMRAIDIEVERMTRALATLEASTEQKA